MKTTASQRGAALIVALVIVAIATILATTLVWQNHLELRRTANQLFGSEAHANLLGMEDFARFLFTEDNPDFDHLQEPWAEQGVVFPIEGGLLTGDIVDLQSRYNINNLINWDEGAASETEVERFRRLLAALGLDERLAVSIVDWLDRDLEPTGFDGAEDDYYSRFVPAYRTPNRPLWHVSELRQVAHMTPEQFAVLEPYITALPPAGKGAEITRVNINTAPPELLVALDEELDPALAAQIVELRAQAGFESLDGLGYLNYSPPPDVFSVNSNWFRLRGIAEIGSSRLTMYSVLHRDTQAGTVRILYRSFGTP